jgi:glycosyltransferase involved in cell wall biosynthesis
VTAVPAMRVAIATRTLARVGGVEAYVERSSRGLARAGHDVCVFAEDRESLPEEPVVARRWTPSPNGPASMVSAIRAYRPDVVITHGLRDVARERALAALHPSVFFAHAYHGTCISGAKAHAFPGVEPCARRLGPGCLLRYHVRRCGGLSPVTMIREYRAQRERLDAVRSHDWVFALSRHVADEYVRHGIPAHRVRLLPPPAPAPPRGDHAAPDRDHLVYLGRLEHLKGPAVAIRAAAAAADRLGRRLVLTIAGGGSGAAAVRRAAAALPAAGLCHVRVAGPLGSEACDGLLSTAGLLVVPSLWPEPFGLVGYEAAAHGVPAAAFRVGGIPEWLIDGVTGHLAESGSDPVASLGGAIVRAIEDERHYETLRAGARAAHAQAVERDHVGTLARALESVRDGARR